ncbi:PepSY domain-containing protein [Zhengella sp. ZM62]|uniref:PepSY domain-containing protein n=1 Tax=Zhengella sedimenti TaxID=3390035 RepID=UPI00397470AE
MIKKTSLLATVITASLGAGAATYSLANDNTAGADKQEMQALASATLSAGDAIKAALAQTPGKVSELQFNLENGVANYEISILGQDGAEHDVAVDATTGKVAAIAANEDENGAMDETDDGGQEDGEADD